MIQFYNQELKRLKDKNLNTKNIDQFISLDETKIKWSGDLKEEFLKGKSGIFKKNQIQVSSYRPFTKFYLYFDNLFNNRISQNLKIFPKNNTKNKVICVSGVGEKTFSVLMTDSIPNVHYMPSGQCFPLYRFDEQSDDTQKSLIEESSSSYSITDSALNRFKYHYKKLTNLNTKNPDYMIKEDIFYYIYGLLHSEDYRERYKSNLDKDLPRIPLVLEFWKFSSIDRKLADLHLNYESQSPPNGVKVLKQGNEINISQLVKTRKSLSFPRGLTLKDLKVNKMKIHKDKTSIIFNDHITVSNIPKETWDYKINGWSALKWIVDRYQHKKDTKTELINDPNIYSEDPAYILKLLLSVITVSLKTQELVRSLPSIDFDSLIVSMDKIE